MACSRELPFMDGILPAPEPRSAAFALFLVLAAAGCSEGKPSYFQGYGEGEYVRVAAPFAGSLDLLAVKRGDQIKAGAPLFALEQVSEQAAWRQAEERLQAAEAQLANLKKGRRAPEMAAIRASIAQAEASLRLSQENLKRQEKLVASGFSSRERLDEARSAFDRDRARIAELNAQLAIARLGARPDEIKAAQAEAKAAQAALAQAEWRLEQKSIKSPVSGLVADTLYVQGEWVSAGSPVVSLLPPENIKVRFFVPETVLGTLHVGQAVTVSCDGCPRVIPAKVSFISPQAEYTPPVIYSRETRSKLVYLVEARPAARDAALLHPGQPVEVRIGKP